MRINMEITSKCINISAPISHVFKYFSDLGVIYDEFQYCLEQEESELEIALEKEHIVFINEKKETLGKISVHTSEPDYCSTLLIEPMLPSLTRFGVINITSTFQQMGDYVMCNSVFKSDRHPSWIWRLLIKAMFNLWLFQSRNYEKEFIKRVEQSA